MEEKTGPCVLIVDDNLYLKRMMTKMLESHGHRVVGTASDAKEAASLYQDLKPDLVTLDLSLGKEHGFRTLMTLKRLDLQARIIVVSSDSRPKAMEEAKNLGACGYVVKPVTWQALKYALEQAAKA